MMLSRTPATATAARGRARAPLSSVNSNLVHKDSSRTPRKTQKASKSKIANSKVISTTKKRRQSKSKTRRKNEIYTPIVEKRRSRKPSPEPRSPPRDEALPIYKSGDEVSQPFVGRDGDSQISTKDADLTETPLPSSEAMASNDASIPVAHLGKNQQQLILNFGYKNVVGKMRSLSFRIEAPPSPTDVDVKFPIEFEHIPFKQGFEVILGGHDIVKQEYVACNVKSVGDTNAPTIIHLKQAKHKIVHVLWAPIHEGEVREEIRLKSSLGKIQISVLGIANGTSKIMPTLEKSNIRPQHVAAFHGRDNITYDAQQWEDKQCATFTTWVNKMFHPENPENKLNPVDEKQLSEEWEAANALFDSQKMLAIRCSVEKEAKEGRLAISPRSNRNVMDEVLVQEKLTKLLLSYSPRWLQLGLEVVLGMNDDRSIKKNNQSMTKESLKRIIKERVLSEPSAVRKYTGGRCKTPSGKFESKMRTTVHQHALSQIMILVFFLDKAKTRRVLTGDPCLFIKSSRMKSSEELLISLCQDCFAKQGSTIRHLDYEGISVSHVQNPLDEYDFYVKDLAVDLKDGVCLAKMIDTVTNRFNLLSSMRLPTTSRQYKVYNVNLALSSLKELGVPNISDITTAHIVNAHQPRILQLLWSTILYFELPEFKQEIIHYKASRLIQSHARQLMETRSYQLARRGMMSFQSLYRGFIVRSTTRTMIKASTTIQKIWRGHHAKLLYGFELMRIITVQSICRRFIASTRVARMSKEMNNASMAIQRIWRGYCSKIDFGCVMMDIIAVQSICRRFIASARVARMSKEMNNASITIQRTWRGYCAKINYGCDMMDIIIVQSICRRFIAYNRVATMYRAMHEASINIERIWRGYNAKLLYGFDLMDIITVQSICRRFIVRKAAARRNECTRKIQSTVRMWAARRLLYNCRKAICTIQWHIRRVIASSHVCYIQRVCRGWLCRKNFIALSIKIAQKVVGSQASPRTHDPIQDDEDISFSTKHAARTEIAKPIQEVQEVASKSVAGVSNFVNVGCHSSCEAPVSPPYDGGDIFFSTKYAARGNVSGLRDRGEEVSSVAGDFNVIETVSDSKTPETQPSSKLHAARVSCLPIDKDMETQSPPRLHSPVVSCDSSYQDCENQPLPTLRNSSLSNSSSPKAWALHDDGEVISVSIKHAPRRHESFAVGKISKLADETEQVAKDYRFINDIKIVPSESNPPQSHAMIDSGTMSTNDTSILSSNTTSTPAMLMTEEEVASALIQKAWRCFSASKLFILKKKAVTVGQSNWRKMVAKRGVMELRQMTRETAATKISCFYRSHATQRDFQLTVASIVTVQKYHRMRSARKIMVLHLKNLEAERNASVIQTHFRRYSCQTKHATLIAGTRSFQARTRGWLARRAAKNVIYDRREKAAVEIQKTYRGFAAFDQFIITKFAAITIQSAFRRHRLATSYRSLRKSAVHAQALFRGRKARQETSVKYEQIRVIQRAGRSFMAKVELRRNILSAAMSLQRTQSVAAVQIQRMWRGYMVNVDFILLFLATIKVQSFARKQIAFAEYGHLLKGVVNIQANFRGKKAREDIATREENSVILQAAGRRFLAKLETKIIISAVSTLQRSARIMITRMNSELESFAATEIQRVYRGFRADVDFILKVLSAITIQAVARGRLARRDAAIQRKAISTLQRATRAMITGMHHEVKHFAAKEIQRVWRGNKANTDFIVMIISGISIQAVVRGMQARQDFAIQQESIHALQRVGRGFLARLERRRAIGAVSTLQRAARVMISRLNNEAESVAAMEIQRFWRGYAANVDFLLIIVSAIKIQSFTRSILEKTKSERLGSGCSSTENSNNGHNEIIARTAQAWSKTRLQTSNQVCAVTLSLTPSFHTETEQFNACNSVMWNGLTQAKSTSVATNASSKVDGLLSTSLVSSQRVGIQVDIRVDIKHSSKFERHTAKAIKTIQKSKKFNEVLKAVMNLEKITMRSIEDCELIVEADVQQNMFDIIQSCNRSSPHLELIQIILSVLTNLAQQPSMLSRLANEKAIDALTDLVQMFRDKSIIFALSSSLLEKMLCSDNQFMSRYSTPENKKRLAAILTLCKKKAPEHDGMRKGICCLENIIRIVNVSCI